jgi:hypothetical protein
MSENQKTQAEQVIDHADKMLLEGYDSVSIFLTFGTIVND